MSGLLIALGCALNVMAFIIAGAAGDDALVVTPPANLLAGSSQVSAPGPSMVAGTTPTIPPNYHHAHAPTSTPVPSAAVLPRFGGLSAGTTSRSTGAESWAARALERFETEAPPPTEAIVEPTPTAVLDMPPATHVTVPAVGIGTDIIEVTPAKSEAHGRTVFTWTVADWAAGHHSTSADPGEGGNIILTGHDDVRGEVFRGLHDIHIGDQVLLTSPAGVFTYAVTEIHLREYRNASPEELIAAGGFLAPMPEERVTLVTCWPYRIDTHRIIVVAKPIASP